MTRTAAPSPTDSHLVEDQFTRIAPYYAQAYRLDVAVPKTLSQRAAELWFRDGDLTLIGAAVAVIQTLDDWRITLATRPRSAA